MEPAHSHAHFCSQIKNTPRSAKTPMPGQKWKVSYTKISQKIYDDWLTQASQNLKFNDPRSLHKRPWEINTVNCEYLTHTFVHLE